ncbi:amino acid dehydrogenase [Fulvitalea axinellae]|uniref:Amino acid dehydrogenase n=1 Tax=Fulvitalea axinellae TaxID=1182444 RepID=A0AAU9CKI6_9BACT|nr:amino acid dehydrogenase [Fulvitalea axinellae]
MPETIQKKIVIVGGGIVGLCAAYYLRQDGHQVTILEKEEKTGQACSAGNAGMIVPSHFIPLAAPGVIAKGIKWMFSPESPFSIKPSLDSELISWLWKFYRSANDGHVRSSAGILKDLNLMSRSLFAEFAQSDDIDFSFGEKGLLMLYNTAKAQQEETETAKMAEKIGIQADMLDAKQVQELEPGIKVNVRGGVHYVKDAHIDPVEFCDALEDFLKSKGVEIVNGAEVKTFGQVNGQIKHLTTQNGERHEADEFVLAAGAFSTTLLQGLNASIPMIAGKGYSVTVPNLEQRPSVPSIFCEAKVAVTPMGDNLRIGGTMELTGRNLSVRKAKVRGILKSIPDYYPDMPAGNMGKLPVWSGLRPCSPDGLPYIGRFQNHQNMIAATGHAMMGVSLGPVTGKLVADIVSGKEPSLPLAQLSPDRYN